VPTILVGASVVADGSACQQVRRGFDHRHSLGGLTGTNRRTTVFILRYGHLRIGRTDRTTIRCVLRVLRSTRTLDLVVAHGPGV
jgi:hypothetical protein